MTKVPNILDHLSVMASKADGFDRAVLDEAYRLCGEHLALRGTPPVTINQNPPPSWPLNLDEWEVRSAMPGETEGGGWWLLPGAGLEFCVRRRSP